MPLILDIDNDYFADACQRATSLDDLMEQFQLSREQVKHLRKRLKSRGYTVPTLQNRRTADNVIEMLPNMTKWEQAKAILGVRLKYHGDAGYKLDGKFASVQEIILESGLTLSP